MKKNIRNGFAFAGVAVILALSFAMPQIVSDAQNKTLKSKVYEMPNPIISSESSLLDRLYFFSSSYAKAVELQPTEKTKTETNRENALQFLFRNEFDEFQEESFAPVHETRLLAISADGFKNAVMQESLMIGENGTSLTLQLDEKSGKMISFYFDRTDSRSENHEMNVERKTKLLADACVEYYGFRSVEIETLEEDGSELWYSYRFIFEGKEGEMLNATFVAAKNMYSFHFG